MEKLIVIINAHKPQMETIDFACRIADLTHSRLTGVFIDNSFTEYIPTAAIDAPSYFNASSDITTRTVTTDLDHATRLFIDECKRQNINADIYTDKGDPIKEAIYESRFADMLIVDPDMNFYEDDEVSLPSHFVKEILANAECPVILSPNKFEETEEIVFCYDGSASSVFAIKQFTYLLPQYASKKVVLLEVNRNGKEEFNESHRKMMSWLRAHYTGVYFHLLKGEAKDELFTYFFLKRKKFIVMGAYGRSVLSNIFRKSNADTLIRMVDLPLFITHH
jgi:hypothetical protein